MEENKNIHASGFPAWWDVIVYILIFLTAQMIVSESLRPLLKNSVESSAFDTLILYTVSMALAMGATLIYIWLRAKNQGLKSVMRPKVSVSGHLLLGAFVLILALGVVLEPLLALFPSNFDFLKDRMNQGSWFIFTAIVAAPILEEILFRGIIQRSFTIKFGAWGAIICSSLIFGVIHLLPIQVINSFFVGLVLGSVYFLTAKIGAVIFLHALNNAVAFLSFSVFPDQHFSYRMLLTNNTEYVILYTVSAVVVIVGFALMVKNLRKYNSELTNSVNSKTEKPESNLEHPMETRD